jgi:hypothetical protein
MPVRFETRRAPREDRDLEQLGSTVVDLTSLVEELAPTTRRRKAAAPDTARPEASRPARPARPPRPRRRRRGRTPAAPPDDTALFDAARCDFASLVKRLDEELGRG